jgi:hypothetical protein
MERKRPRRRARRNNQNKRQQIATKLTISNLTYGRDPEQKPADVAQSGQKDQIRGKKKRKEELTPTDRESNNMREQNRKPGGITRTKASR